jgi:hypothetical protein
MRIPVGKGSNEKLSTMRMLIRLKGIRHSWSVWVALTNFVQMTPSRGGSQYFPLQKGKVYLFTGLPLRLVVAAIRDRGPTCYPQL